MDKRTLLRIVCHFNSISTPLVVFPCRLPTSLQLRTHLQHQASRNWFFHLQAYLCNPFRFGDAKTLCLESQCRNCSRAIAYFCLFFIYSYTWQLRAMGVLLVDQVQKSIKRKLFEGSVGEHYTFVSPWFWYLPLPLRLASLWNVSLFYSALWSTCLLARKCILGI